MLDTLFENIGKERVNESFANVISALIESSEDRDSYANDFVITTNDVAMDDIKNEAMEEEIMNSLLEKVPETEIDPSIVFITKNTNQIANVRDSEMIGAPIGGSTGNG